MKASSLSFCTAVCLGIVGMTIGIAMAASGNHSAFPRNKVFCLVEAEATNVSKAPNKFTIISGTGSLGTILDQC